jgi:hypothetical protein
MAEIPDDSDSDSDDESNSFYDDEEEDEILTSFRMFHQQLNGQEVEEEVDSDVDSVDWSDVDSDEDSSEGGVLGFPVVVEEEEELVEGQSVIQGQTLIQGQPVIQGGVLGAPPVVDADSAHITQKLMERGITFEDLVKTILFHEHDNYADRYAHHERRSSEIYGQFKAVMSRFRNEQTRRPNLNQVVPQVIPQVIPQVVPIPQVASTLEKTLTFSHTEITLHHI